MSYGFRLYELKAVEGPRGRTSIDWLDPFGTAVSALNHIETVVTELTTSGVLNGSANHSHPDLYDPEADVVRGDPQAKFLACTRLAPDQILIHLDYGVVGEYDRSYDGGGESVSMRERSTDLRLRLLIVAPQGTTTGLLVAETWKSLCPTVTALGAIGWKGYVTGERYVRLKASQVADKSHLQAMADDADSVEAVLTQRRPGAAGARDGERIRLAFKTGAKLSKAALIMEALAAISGKGLSKHAAIERIETVAGFDPQELETANLKFGEVSLAIEKNGETKTVNLDNILARFTYRAGPVDLDDEAWIDLVMPTAHRVMSEVLDIDLQVG